MLACLLNDSNANELNVCVYSFRLCKSQTHNTLAYTHITRDNYSNWYRKFTIFICIFLRLLEIIALFIRKIIDERFSLIKRNKSRRRDEILATAFFSKVLSWQCCVAQLKSMKMKYKPLRIVICKSVCLSKSVPFLVKYQVCRVFYNKNSVAVVFKDFAIIALLSLHKFHW